MHKLRLIHKDIKPPNILYSHEQEDYVLCDFGISHFVVEEVGWKSPTYRDGTSNFMTEEMANMSSSSLAQIDLYWNDLHGINKSLAIMADWTSRHNKKPTEEESAC